MKRSSVVNVELTGPVAKLLKAYAKDHRISADVFLQRALETIDFESAFEETSDIIEFERRRNEPTVPLEEVMKRDYASIKIAKDDREFLEMPNKPQKKSPRAKGR